MKKLIKPKPIKKKENGKVYEKILKDDENIQKQCELTCDIDENENIFKNIFSSCYDVVFRSIKILGEKKALIIYADGLVDNKILDDMIIDNLMKENAFLNINDMNIGDFLKEQVIPVGQLKDISSIEEAVKAILDGNAIILVENEPVIFAAAIGGGQRRNINEPVTETVIRGPREGFTEDIRINISMLRRRLKTPKLKMELSTIGEMSKSNIIITYIKGVAEESVIEEVRKRLGKIKIDAVLESGYIEEFIEDEPYTLFPLVQNTERPDVVAAAMLEGKVAIFTDNTPFVLLVPVVFWGQVHANEDYYERFSMGTIIRWIRLSFMFISLLVPALYVAVSTFHQQMIPPKLLMSIVDAREPSPFPAVIEALIMEVTFEALREAGVRLPKPVGQAVSIVGALVIGQAAVEAGLVSAPMVIVVSLTGIASFTMPRYDFAFAVRMLRFPLILMAGSFGLYGVTLGVMAMLIHLVGLRSFGIPYLSPVAPLNLKGLKDVLIRAPHWNMHKRPELITSYNEIRVPEGQKPETEQERKDSQK
ncbi:spore germination protein A1 [Oxobacter pfennigii]|uniref:Spore germination protein A1 n=1 Tax=Oxobacter pfennigii TaxID=36849 RepID=A0A0P8WPS2_9CLOT|nr:spore germination protein [Oxobacter pfennigii]KPU44551.1 spore germination protein A1 [Oxobacter pfennigii]